MAIMTKAQLAQAVLEEMVVIDPTETADSEDTDKVISAYELKWSDLAHERNAQALVWWPRDDIPDDIFLLLRDLIINEVARTFGEPMDPITKLSNEEAILRRLRKKIGRHATGEATQAEYM